MSPGPWSRHASWMLNVPSAQFLHSCLFFFFSKQTFAWLNWLIFWHSTQPMGSCLESLRNISMGSCQTGPWPGDLVQPHIGCYSWAGFPLETLLIDPLGWILKAELIYLQLLPLSSSQQLLPGFPKAMETPELFLLTYLFTVLEHFRGLAYTSICA